MEIILVPSTFYTDPTYYRVLSSLRREFTARRHSSVILSGRTAANPELQIKPEPGAVCACGGRRPRSFNKFFLSYLCDLPPGAVVNFHFSGWLRSWHAPALLADELAKARLVVTFQDYRHPDLPPLTSAALVSMRKILLRAHAVTAVSGFLARMIRKDFPLVADKLFVIPNGTDVPAKANSAGRPVGRRYIFTVGRAAPYKGLDLLLFAFAKAVGKRCDADLVICGTDGRGALSNLAQKLGIADHVIFKGLLPPGKIPALMRGCLFYATAPRWESFGMAALEAMAAGKTVLASKTGGLSEFARNGRNAVLVVPADIENISSAMARLCADNELREALGRNAAATALKYSWSKIADKYIRFAYR